MLLQKISVVTAGILTLFSILTFLKADLRIMDFQQLSRHTSAIQYFLKPNHAVECGQILYDMHNRTTCIQVDEVSDQC